MTQVAFAKALSVSRSAVVDWEAGGKISTLGIGALNRLRASTLEAGANKTSAVRETPAVRYGVPESTVLRETLPPPAESTAQLAGRSLEIEALLAYAMDRQRQLGQALSAAAIAEGVRESVRRSAEALGQQRAAK